MYTLPADMIDDLFSKSVSNTIGSEIEHDVIILQTQQVDRCIEQIMNNNDTLQIAKHFLDVTRCVLIFTDPQHLLNAFDALSNGIRLSGEDEEKQKELDTPEILKEIVAVRNGFHGVTSNEDMILADLKVYVLFEIEASGILMPLIGEAQFVLHPFRAVEDSISKFFNVIQLNETFEFPLMSILYQKNANPHLYHHILHIARRGTLNLSFRWSWKYQLIKTYELQNPIRIPYWSHDVILVARKADSHNFSSKLNHGKLVQWSSVKFRVCVQQNYFEINCGDLSNFTTKYFQGLLVACWIICRFVFFFIQWGEIQSIVELCALDEHVLKKTELAVEVSILHTFCEHNRDKEDLSAFRILLELDDEIPRHETIDNLFTKYQVHMQCGQWWNWFWIYWIIIDP